MPLHNVTIDDASALIGYYNPNGIPWKDSPTNDSGLGEYADHTYHSSNQTGAWATFQFQGTAVYLFAATRIMHGKYNIFIDDQYVYEGNGYSRTSIFNQLVFNATGLPPARHNLTFVNTDPGLYIEVDYITWTTVMPAALTESPGTTISYVLGNMTYDASIWDENAPGSSPYMVTKTNGATVNIPFKGNGIELYGRTGPEYGLFGVQIDNLDPYEFDAFSLAVHNTLLFRQDNLTDGDHTLTVTNRGNASLGIASAVPIIWSNGQNQGRSHDANGRVIAGVVIGLSLGIAILAFLWFWFAYRRDRYQDTYDDHFKTALVYEPTYEATPFIYPPAGFAGPTAPHSPRHYSYEGAQGPSYPARYQPLPTSPGSGSWPRFEHHPSVTTPLSPAFNFEPGSPGSHAYNRPPLAYTNSRPRKSDRPVAPASRPEEQSSEVGTSLRDRQVDLQATFIRG